MSKKVNNIVNGKLVLVIPVNFGKGNWYGETIVKIGKEIYHPILIDNDNPIKTGDEYIYFGGFNFSKNNYSIRTCASNENARTANCGRSTNGNSGWKILANPDDFPKEIVKKIELGEIKDLEDITFTIK
jgi:hypothetical protein